ncbi:MAG: GAF domain-containing protein, partial [Gammaproteobacteria bacterium]|nr:GAF domain-containing protein [Gammaproteobacteria bacterium]
MIWGSLAAMTIVDVVIIGLICASLTALHKDRQTVRRLGLNSTVDVIYFALVLIGLFYLSDLLIMHVLPLITSHAYAMQIMKELHLNWSWIVFLIAVSVVTVGLTHLVRSVVPKVVSSITERERAEQELRRARDELEVRVKKRTRALQVEITERKQAEEALAERARRVEGLIRTSARVAESIEETDETLGRIAEEAANLLGVEGAGFRLLEGHDDLVAAGRYGLAQEVMTKHSLKVGESLTGLVAQEGRTITVADLREDERFDAEHKQAAISHGIVAFLGVPLRYRDRLMGVLNVYGKERHVFDDEEVSLLRVFADHAAIAIEKARLYGQAKRHAEALGKEITERTQAEEVLRRYEHIVSASSDLMAFIDTAYRYQAVNAAYLEAFGKHREDMIGREVAEILGTEIFETRMKPRLDQCLSGKRVKYQHWLDLPGRGHRYFDAHYDPFRDADGAVTGVVVNVRDISEARELSEQLSYQASHDALTGLLNRRAFEQRLQQLLATAQ